LWNDCDHLKRVVIAKHHTLGYYSGVKIGGWACPGTTVNSPAEERIFRHFAEFYTSVQVKPYPNIYVLPDDPGMDNIFDLNFRAEAWANFQPRFKGEVSLLNFLFELKDFRDIATDLCGAVSKFLSGLRNDASTGFKYLRVLLSSQNSGFHIMTPPSALRDNPGLVSTGLDKAAQAWLTNSFAIQPLIKDIAALLANFMQLATTAYKKFKTDGEQEHTVHFSRDFNVSQNLVPLGPYTTPSVSNPYYTGQVAYTRRTASMMRTYSCAPQSNFLTSQKYWGLEWTHEVIWNMMPWTFLCDYVFSVGKALRLSQRDKGVDLNTIQYCESTLSTNEDGIFINPYFTDMYYVDDVRRTPVKLLKGSVPLIVTGLQHMRYQRRLREPYFGPYLPSFSGLNTKQQVNVLALLRVLFS
jgi:hypothetical protein